MVRAASEDLRLRTEQRQYTSALGGGGVEGGWIKYDPRSMNHCLIIRRKGKDGEKEYG